MAKSAQQILSLLKEHRTVLTKVTMTVPKPPQHL